MKIVKAAKKRGATRGSTTRVVVHAAGSKLIMELFGDARSGSSADAELGVLRHLGDRYVLEAPEMVLRSSKVADEARRRQKALTVAKRHLKSTSFSRGATLLQDPETAETTAAIAKSAHENLRSNRAGYEALFRSALKR